ncbi:MAG: hypothetical protein ACK5LC_09995 [Coprobacillaceae bacterium]
MKMKKIRINMLVFVLVLSLFTALSYNTTISANDTITMQEEIIYSDNKKEGNIIFNLEDVDTGYTIQQIENPDGTMLDLQNPIYTVKHNGTFTFKVTYLNTTNVTEEILEKTVVIDGIKENSEDTIHPRTVEVDGGLTLEIPEYSGTGWENGAIKTLNFYVDFSNDNTSNGKKLIINIAEGMRYDQILVAGTYSKAGIDTTLISEYPSADPLYTAITSTTIPKKEAANTYGIAAIGSTYGNLEYTFDSGMKAALISVKVRVDGHRYYGPHTISKAISGKLFMGDSNNVIGELEQDVETSGEAIIGPIKIPMSVVTNGGDANAFVSTNEETSYAITAQTELHFSNGQFLTTTGARHRYYKSIKAYLYYPEGMKFEELLETLPKDALITDDQINSRVIVEASWQTSWAMVVKYSIPQGTPIGSYTNKDLNYAEIEYYDGTKETVVQANTYVNTVEVIDKSSFVNQMRIVKSGDEYDNDLASDTYVHGPHFRVNNNTPGIKKNQEVHYVIGENWQVEEVNLPFDGSVENNTITNIRYKTNKNGWQTYTLTDMKELLDVKGSNGVIAKTLTKELLQLDEDEYFLEVKAEVGTFSQTYTTLGGRYTNSITMYGNLKSGITSESVTVSMYDKDDKTGTIMSATGNVYATPSNNIRISSNATAKVYDSEGSKTITQLAAGSSFVLKSEITTNPYPYGTSQAIKNPEIYIREPEGMNIGIDALEILDYENKSVPFTYERIQRENDAVYIIKTTDAIIGNYFGRNKKVRKLYINCPIATEMKIAGTFYIRDLIAWGHPDVSKYEGSLWLVDTLDFNGNGDETELLLSVPVSDLKIAEFKNVLVETFLTLSGEEPKAPYVSTDKNTLAYFTPGTKADYTINITNTADSAASEFEVYIPIPKTGSNFGESFQSEDFTWDMTLINPIVINEPGFEVLYSTDADASNYESTASYSTTPPLDLSEVKMVKIRATSEIAPKVEAEIKVPLQVDETFETASGDNKIGEKNVYNPVYNVVSPTFDGGLPGTKVGTELVIAEIGGTVFLDKNGDGLFKKEDADEPLKNEEIGLYKWDEITKSYIKVLDTDNTHITVKTNNDGEYLFDYTTELGYGKYAVHFIEKDMDKYQYTVHNRTNTNIDSDAIMDGSNKGWVLDIDPTKPYAKTIGCGFIEYDSEIEPVATINTNPNQVKVGNTIMVGSTIAPTFWNNIKDPTTPYTWEIVGDANEQTKATLVNNNDGTVTITPKNITTGIITFQMTLTIKDIYGNVKTSAPATITIIATTPPTITTTDLDVYVGDTVNLLDGIKAKDNTGNDILLNALPGSTQNTTIVQDIPMTDNRYTTPGTYNINYTINDVYGNVTTKSRSIRVHGLPTINANGQEYVITDPTILTNIQNNPTASYLVAGSTVGSTPTSVNIPGPANTVGGNNTIKYEIVTGPSMDFSVAGIYQVKYTATDPNGKTTDKTVDVFIKPTESITDSTGTYIINANDFTIENGEAKELTETLVKNNSHGNASAIKKVIDKDGNITYVDVSDKITVNISQLTAIKSVTKVGGVFTLSYTIKDEEKTISKDIQVTVNMATDELVVSVDSTDYIVKEGNNITITPTINLSYWDEIKDTTTPYTWELVNSSDSAYVSLNGTSQKELTISGTNKTTGIIPIKITVKDALGRNSTAIANIRVVTSEAPIITVPSKTVYIGDTVDLVTDVTVLDGDNNNISLITSGDNKNTQIDHQIEIVDNKYVTAGTYNVTYKIVDQWGNEGIVNGQIKVHGLPEISGDTQEYTLGEDDILLGVTTNPKASWLCAGDTVGDTPTEITIVGPATLDTSGDIQYTVLSGPNNTLDFSEAGVYSVQYTATNVDGKTCAITVDVTVKSRNSITDGTNSSTKEEPVTSTDKSVTTTDNTNLLEYSILLILAGGCMILQKILKYKQKL